MPMIEIYDTEPSLASDLYLVKGASSDGKERFYEFDDRRLAEAFAASLVELGLKCHAYWE